MPKLVQTKCVSHRNEHCLQCRCGTATCQYQGKEGARSITDREVAEDDAHLERCQPCKTLVRYHSPEIQPLPEPGCETLWELPGRTCLAVAGVDVALPPPLQQVLERGQAAFLGRRRHLPGHAPRHSHSPTPLGQPGTGPPPPLAALPAPRRPRARQPAPTTRSRGRRVTTARRCLRSPRG